MMDEAVNKIGCFFSSRRRHTRWNCDWSSDVCSSDLSGTASNPGDESQSHQTVPMPWVSCGAAKECRDAASHPGKFIMVVTRVRGLHRSSHGASRIPSCRSACWQKWHNKESAHHWFVSA